MSETSEAHGEAIAGVAWSGDPRVTVSPTHITVDIQGGYGPAENDVQADLEKNPDNAPPDSIKLRRKLFGKDLIAQDNFGPGDHAIAAGMACSLGNLKMRHFERMNIRDSRLVILIVSELCVGKG